MDYSNSVEVSEIIENLEELEKRILKIEMDNGGNNLDSQDIHIAFRFAHNLKSLLAMYGKNNCSKLIHAIESNFDLVRKGKAPVTDAITHKSLLAVDLIKTNLEELPEDEYSINNLIRSLEIINMQNPSNTNIIENIALQAEEVKILSQLKHEKHNIFLLEKIIGTKLEKDTFFSLPVFQDIQEIGKLIAFSPKYNDLPENSEECLLKVLFASKLSEPELEYVIFDPIKKIVPGNNEKQMGTSNKIGDSTSSLYFKILLLEDDFIERRHLSKILSGFGQCEIACNISEVISAVKYSLKENNYYNLICIGIKSDFSQYSLIREIRNLEEKENIMGSSGSKILAVTEDLDCAGIIDIYKNYCDMHIKRFSDEQYMIDSIKNMIYSF